ncbi:MAG: bifunctional 4-hydroxy-3-methylbut-2-enyl diphosphate reductase/30S ribosomal protein S1 [Saccharofermentanales bacterium]|jgi:small subunit ribosomal protein S1
MKIRVASSAGFCPGVRHAVDLALKTLEGSDPEERTRLWMLGPLVHNERVIDNLTKRGLKLAHDVGDIPNSARVIIRAHGISPSVEAELKRKECELIDGTCGFVKKLQHTVGDSARSGKGIIIAGRANHPEVIGVIGYANPEIPVVIETPEQADKATFEDREWILVAQTTFYSDHWRLMCKKLENKIAKLQIFDTICNTTVKRQSDAKALAASSDIMFVLGSRTSSNTARLAEVCEEQCAFTHVISRPDQVDQFIGGESSGSKRIGITTGASTPDSMIREVVHRMTEKEGMTKPEEQQDINFAEFIESIPELQPKTIVHGRIVRYDDDYVYVDVKDKSEGKIPMREMEKNPDFDLDEAVKTQQEIEVYIRSIRYPDSGKEILLSVAQVDTLKQRKIVEEAYEEKTPLTVKVSNVVRDGVIASYGSIDVYIHRTQLELQRVEDLEPYRDQSFDILITQFDQKRRRLRVSGSRRSLLQRERKKNEKFIWETIEEGKQYEGIVRNLTNFGAFIDIGGVDGLVHISEISWQRIRHPSEVLSVGDKIDVYVKDFDRARKRISLGYRKEEEDPYYNIEERFPVGSIVRGIVVRMFPFGAFINIAPGVDALCHISQVSNYHLNRPEDVLAEGMEVDARVVEVSNDARRISISIRDVEPINPDPEVIAQLEQPPQQGRRQGRDENRRRSGRRGSKNAGFDNLPTSYVDDQARSSISDMAEIRTVTEAGSKLLNNVRREDQKEDDSATEDDKKDAVEVPSDVEDAVVSEPEVPEVEQADVPTEDVSEPVVSDEEVTSTDSEEDPDSKDAEEVNSDNNEAVETSEKEEISE